MVYTYGIDNPNFSECTVQDVYFYFMDLPQVEVDSETFGFDPYTKDLMCLQLGDFNNQYVIHPDKVHEFKQLLETKLLLFHNAKFDLKFLYIRNIWPNKVYDTMLAERVLFCGIKAHRAALNIVAYKRLGISLDKSVRDSIWKEGLTARVIEYAADDVKYLGKIKESQYPELCDKGLLRTLDLENSFVIALAYIEFCGFKLSREKWQAKMVTDLETFESARKKLDEFIFENKLDKFIDHQGDLFNPNQKVKINWASSKQVIQLFEHLEIPVEIEEKGVKKKSVEEKHIAKYGKVFPIVKDYLDYKGTEKIIGTYGKTWLNKINPVTQRVHTNFSQVMDTGRISSGGKNKETKEDYPNFQNIPKDKITRACFVADEGNTLVIADYAGQEQIVLANKSMDPGLLHFYDNKLYEGDMHSFVTTRIWPELDGLSLKEIKDEHSDKRNKAKNAGFAINYGGVGATIAANLNLTVEEGDAIYNAYFEAFPELGEYFHETKQQGLRDGYILIDDVIFRKSFVDYFSEFKEQQKEFTKVFWDKYREKKTTYWEAKEVDPDYRDYEFESMRKKVSDWFKFKGKIERDALNYPIQGTSANITKISAILIFKWIKERNLTNIVKFVNQVHDENCLECPIEMALEVKEMVEKAMADAADIFCKRVPLRAEAEITPFWKK